MAECIENPGVVSEPPPCTEISDPSVLSNNPLVSIHMMAYNHAPYISQAIEGVLQQEKSFPIELVIGEDFSTDRTREIVFSFQKKYPNIIRVITSGENVGAHKNNDRVRKACRGKYIAFCEGDDYWHDPYKLKKQADYLENNPHCGLVYSSYDIYNAKKNIVIKDFIRYRKWEIIENSKLTDYFITLNKVGGRRVGILTCTVMVRKNLYEHIINSDPYLHNSGNFLMGDTQVWVEIINSSTVHYIPESMATHIITDESATRSKDMKKLLRFNISNAELMIYLCKKYNLSSNIREKYESDKLNNLLRLAHITRNYEIAEEVRKSKMKMDYIDWLRYLGAINIVFFYICWAGIMFKNIFNRGNDDWR